MFIVSIFTASIFFLYIIILFILFFVFGNAIYLFSLLYAVPIFAGACYMTYKGRYGRVDVNKVILPDEVVKDNRLSKYLKAHGFIDDDPQLLHTTSKSPPLRDSKNDIDDSAK